MALVINNNEPCVEEDEQISKKLRTSIKLESTKEEIKVNSPTKIVNERCNICRQYVDNVLLYNGHPNKSVDEFVALTDEKLLLFTGTEAAIHEQDEFPTNKVLILTHFH